jgi:hypothetical protein
VVAEYRQIIFSNDEVIRAIVAFDNEQEARLPPGNIVACALSRSAPLVAHVTLQEIYGNDEHSVELNAGYLAAVLIHACIAAGIPIPKKAEKTLTTVGQTLSLNFTLHPEPEPRGAKYAPVFLDTGI